MFCPSCGKSIKDNSRFCMFCGADITQFEPEAEESPPSEVNRPVSADGRQIPTARKNSKTLQFIIPVVILLGAAAFVFLWDGGSIWKGRLGTAQTPEEPLVNDGSLESALRYAAAVYLSESDTPGAESWQNTSVHVTYLSGDYCDFAVTSYDGGDGDRMVAQLNATVNENGGTYTASDIEWHWETVVLSHGENYFDNEHESVTNADPSAFTLIPNKTKSDTYMDFEREDKEAFTFNGIQIMSGVHDTQENYDAYAQPTKIELTAYDSGGAYQTVTLPVIPCGFQGFPFAIVLDEPLEDTRNIVLKFLETDGTQEYIAVSEVSFF